MHDYMPDYAHKDKWKGYILDQGFQQNWSAGRAFPTLSTIAEVVIDDSIHKMAVMASSRVTSFRNISLACAAT